MAKKRKVGVIMKSAKEAVEEGAQEATQSFTRGFRSVGRGLRRALPTTPGKVKATPAVAARTRATVNELTSSRPPRLGNKSGKYGDWRD